MTVLAVRLVGKTVLRLDSQHVVIDDVNSQSGAGLAHGAWTDFHSWKISDDIDGLRLAVTIVDIAAGGVFPGAHGFWVQGLTGTKTMP